MNPDVRVALEESASSDVPFRAITSHRHHTWAKTFHSRPELYLQPQSLPEIEKIVNLARRCRRRISMVGAGHSPSDLTCTSTWLINLDDYAKITNVDTDKSLVTMQSGIRLRDLGLQLKEYGLAMPNLGSINDQSIAGAISTGTHGSSLRHGILSESVKDLRITLANGRTVSCSATQNEDLFQASLVSLGALGIITELTFQAVPTFDIKWQQSIIPLASILADWEKELWTQAEFVRVWWIPYTKRGIIWKADKTTEPRKAPKASWYGGSLGFHTYQTLLYISTYIPRILPTVEWFVFGMQYGFRNGPTASAVEEARTGLLMDCLFSQFVNEWALPLSRGPEAITRLSAWIHGDEVVARIPISSKGVYVHAPIEVRVSDTTNNKGPRPLLDPTSSSGPTLYLNATLYRPHHVDPPGHETYYAAFEFLMKELGGRPHWAKNFSTVSHADFEEMYGEKLQQWRSVRSEVDPEGLFAGDWHRRNLLEDGNALTCEEREAYRIEALDGGWDWEGERARSTEGSLASRPGSAESYEIMHGAEAASVFFEKAVESSEGE